MEETPQIEVPTTKRAKRKYVKSDIVLIVGKTRVPADSFTFTDKFLVVKSGRKQTYFALDGLASFSVEDKRKDAVAQAAPIMALAAAPPPQHEAGGPKAFAAEMFARQRNKQLEAAMGQIPSEA